MILLIAFSSSSIFANENVVFRGIPEIKVSEGGVSRVAEKLTQDQAGEYQCTITQMNEKFYWATRDNVELIPLDSGAFVTFLAINGSGYIRVVKPEMKEIVKKVGALANDPEEKFDYVEHLMLGLKSITYYGRTN